MTFNIVKKKNGSSPIAILIIIAVLLISLMVGKSIAQAPQFSFILIAALAVGLITVVNTQVALIILIFSMLLSPELQLAEVAGRGVVLRIDDILLIVIFFTWIAKMAINKQLGLLRRTPLNRLIVAYIAVSLVSTALGIASGSGDIASLPQAIFFIIKYIEYFMIFFMVTNNVRDKRQIKVFIAAFL